MFPYAQLNEKNICIGVSLLKNEVDNPSLISIPTIDEDYLNRKYENGQWSQEKFVEDTAAVELSRMDNLENRTKATEDALLALIMNGGI